MILITKLQIGISTILFLAFMAYMIYEIMRASAVSENTETIEKIEDIDEDMSSYINPDKDIDIKPVITDKNDPKGVAVLTEHIASIVETNPKSVKKLSKEEMQKLNRIKQRYNRKHSKE